MIAVVTSASTAQPALSVEAWLMAQSECLICCQPIGFDRPFYRLKGGLVHADCFHEQRQGDY